MISLLILWAVVFMAAGAFIEHMRPHWLHGDDVRRLAAADRRRLREQRETEHAFLMAEIHGDDPGW